MSRVRVLVGTHRGAFILSADGKRDRWDIAGPLFAGQETFHVAGSPANPNRVYATPFDRHAGQLFFRSDNGGMSWDKIGGATVPVRHLEPSLTDPETVYALDDEHALFRSVDGGQSWVELSGLRREMAGASAETGDAAEPCPNALLLDPSNPDRIFAAVASTGIYRTTDGGQRWQRVADTCVHGLAMHRSNVRRVYAQSHDGVMRSDDGGDTWESITSNLPGTYGMPVEVHAADPDVAFVVPMKNALEHYPPEGKLRVYRSRTGGSRWDPLTTGLPQRDCYVNVSRNALAVDGFDPCGVYFGTSGGGLYGSNDAGESWTPLALYLPPVYSVEVQTIP